LYETNPMREVTFIRYKGVGVIISKGFSLHIFKLLCVFYLLKLSVRD